MQYATASSIWYPDESGPSERATFAGFRQRQGNRLSKELVAAFEATARTAFVPEQWREAAWSDRMVPIDCGEAIEGIDLQATVLQALGVEPGHRVLEVGTGTGYTAVLLARLSARVTTIERYRTLAEAARQRYEQFGITSIAQRHADGSSGLHANGPYDRIVVWAAFDSLPRTFVDQLATNGIMIAPIGPGEGEQDLAKLTKVGSRFEREDIARVRFQPIARTVAARI